MTIPRSAVIRSGGMTRVVLSEGEGKYRSARIDVGREASDRIEVIQGLSLDDVVVTSAQFMLDSESSQSADLSRINGVEPPAESVWASGEITKVMSGHSMLTINHQPFQNGAGQVWSWTSLSTLPWTCPLYHQVNRLTSRWKKHRKDNTSLPRLNKLKTPCQVKYGGWRNNNAHGRLWHDHNPAQRRS
ncbi:membrane fusion protein CzcB family [Vibrio variabilis]|uniref:Membrane fusion protein CzcB family n=1 Tax=Vibrio variabilis TaxID=990271 RepID=A0ABQ0JCN8_9VIBR|nr:membrane fusion protein CzcB family [Vibrio variabilis]